MTKNLAKKELSREYSALLTKLFSKPMNPKLGLKRMNELLSLIDFDHPYPVIQVVGTNGKGSTVAFLESILLAHGFKTGLFTSPHLCCARERIRINGSMISEYDFCASGLYVLDKAKSMSDEPSFFECILAMALLLFKQHGLQYYILEAGIGGRLDATTATKPDILGVSFIDLDHQHILGDTVEKIAQEKIAASQPHQIVVYCLQNPLVKEVIEHSANSIGFKAYLSSAVTGPLGLYGEHQQHNAGLAVEILRRLGINLLPKQTAQGLLNVNWPGRFEILVKNNRLIVLDGAHNPSGIIAFINSLYTHPQIKGQPLVLIYGSLAGDNAYKKIETLVQSKLNIRHVFIHTSKNPRALAFDDVISYFKKAGFLLDSTHQFYDWLTVKKLAQNEHAVVAVCGSLYTVGEIRSLLLSCAIDEKPSTY